MTPEEIKNIFDTKYSNITKEIIAKRIQYAISGKESIDEIKKSCNFLLDLLPIVTLPIGQSNLYRARKSNNITEFYSELNEYLQPPKDITPLGRCNLKNSPCLYVTNHPHALIPENHFNAGDIFHIIQFDHNLIQEDINCFFLGIDFELQFSKSNTIKQLVEVSKNYLQSHFEMYKFLQTELSKAFVIDYSENPHVYSFTAEICTQLFIGMQSLDAILYPSIATKGLINNLALKPENIFKTYKPTKVGVYETINQNQFRELICHRLNNKKVDFKSETTLDWPRISGIRTINPNDSRIYIAPWK